MVKKMNAKDLAREMIGDGKLPNWYFVSWSNDFYICEDGVCDWASDTQKFKVKGDTYPISYGTFGEALAKAEEFISGMPDVPREDTFNSVIIEDRLSGQVFDCTIHAYHSDDGILLGYKFEVTSHTDVDFTRKEMEKRGYEFE